MKAKRCESCHEQCKFGWCRGPLLSDCLECEGNLSQRYRDFTTWQCLDNCQAINKTNVEQIAGDNNQFKYCLESLFFVDSYDLKQLQPNLEFGTKQFPFRSLDDAFRTIFNNQHNNATLQTIYINHGSNLSIHSEDMPLILLNSNIEIRPYSENE